MSEYSKAKNHYYKQIIKFGPYSNQVTKAFKRWKRESIKVNKSLKKK